MRCRNCDEIIEKSEIIVCEICNKECCAYCINHSDCLSLCDDCDLDFNDDTYEYKYVCESCGSENTFNEDVGCFECEFCGTNQNV